MVFDVFVFDVVWAKLVLVVIFLDLVSNDLFAVVAGYWYYFLNDDDGGGDDDDVN